MFLALTTVLLLSFILLINFFIKKNSNFKISKKTDKIIIGHSHSECAFDDSVISNFTNFSDSGEAYFYNYFKIVELLKQNPQIKVVFVELSNNQILESADKKIWEDKYMSNRFPLYAPFMDFSSQKLLLENNTAGFLDGLSLAARDNLAAIWKGDYKYTKKIGGFRRLKRDNLLEALASRENETNSGEIKSTLSQYDLYYLKKIIDLCKEKKVSIYLVRSPLHSEYQGLRNEELYQQALRSLFFDLELLDFKNFPLASSEFGDPQHLNYRGAKKFSGFFNQLLEKGLLEKANKQIVINEEIRKINPNE